jgi:hypothetical protein
MQREENWGADCPWAGPKTAVTQCVRKQNACGNLMIIGHSQAGKWR